MEARARRHSAAAAATQASPERTKVWVEPPPKSHHHHKKQRPAAATAPSSPQQGKKVPVVYYLCRNRLLEHPHFIEVPLASPEGLYLRDVINRLNVLRGKGMAAMYSWSCKRSYKNGFVWHDLSEDDLILPAHGNEYILKGSELLDRSPPDRQYSRASNQKVENLIHPREESPNSRGTQEGCSSSSSPGIVIKEATPPSPPPQPPPTTTALPPSPPASTIREDEQCRTPQSGSLGNMSPEPTGRNARSSGASSPSLTEYRVCKPVGAQDASTQTDDRKESMIPEKDTRTTGVSTDDGPSDAELQERDHKCMQRSAKGPEILEESPPPSSYNASSGGRIDTLESLIRAEASKRNNFRVLQQEDIFGPINAKLRPANLLMQLITCGSISVKDHRSFGLIPTYRPRFTQVEFPSPMFSTPVALRHLEHFAGNPRTMGLRFQESEYFSGSFLETKKQKEERGKGVSTLKRSSSYDEDRTYKTADSKRDIENLVDSASLKCLPQTIKMISCKQSRSGTIFSPMSDARSISGQQECSSRSSPLGSSKSTSKRMNDALSVRESTMSVESFHEEKEKVIKIEESFLLELGL